MRLSIFLSDDAYRSLMIQRERMEREIGVPVSVSAYISKLITDHAEND